MSHYYDNDSSMISDAASPGLSELLGAKENTRHGKFMDNITSEERGCITDTGSKITEVINEEFFSAELKKRGLCVVPLSMLSNFIA
ncbi:unnamed protein product [Arabis nemorensis]|uniref:Uncharacterized protein n=1 Tax=Arabis nemorensis TaxID=586526 RepID=A0A565BHX2_9BRAS|nr:unnamed protein product [Arabis nemorensis]